jgi:hypothetical protein
VLVSVCIRSSNNPVLCTTLTVVAAAVVVVGRCGARYVVTEQQLELGIELYGCSGCSLVIRVLFQVEAAA